LDAIAARRVGSVETEVASDASHDDPMSAATGGEPDIGFAAEGSLGQGGVDGE
jgi:hypothetical protein